MFGEVSANKFAIESGSEGLLDDQLGGRKLVMAKSSMLRVMLSSRCDAIIFPGDPATFSDVRLDLKNEIEAMEIAGRSSFEVWINETTDPQGGGWDAAEVCINAAKDCDILLVISNGDAGFASGADEVGICHVELKEGLSNAPAKVRIVAIDNIAITRDEAGVRNKRFQDFLAQQNLFRGAKVTSVTTLKERVRDALHNAVVSLAQAGVRDAARGKFHSGPALDWSRLNFDRRQAEMIGVLRATLRAREGSFEESDRLFSRMDGRDILFETSAIPAALTIGPAREMVGQPFLRDHTLVPALTGKRGGPVHVIACHKSVTESQATKLLGFPDATFVAAPFGIFVADPIQKVQFAFIANCRDETNTRHGLQGFMKWLGQTGEERHLATRAQARTRIVRAIAKEATRRSPR